jgi:hypothetical protein
MLGECVQFNKEYKMGIASDGVYKTQVKYPTFMDLHNKAFILHLAEIEWKGLYNLY